MNKILEVKNLAVSFRTSSGTLRAVRNISFDLERGKTLAIVGESGSGKSVTSKAILGILAGNSIVESGEIVYDGKDLLKISEQQMCDIRGDSISMIFQDPLSSLNPIVKIGMQITEAMLLKNKTSRTEARKDFNGLLSELEKYMAAATGDAAMAKQLCSTFDKFCIEANKLERSYNDSVSWAQDMTSSIEDLLFKTEKHQKMDAKGLMSEYRSKLKRMDSGFFTAKYQDELTQVAAKLATACGQVKRGSVTELPESVSATLKELQELLSSMTQQTKPNFFCIGYYAMKNPNEKLENRDIAELNQTAFNFLNEDFMNEFLRVAEQTIAYSAKESVEKKKEVVAALEEAKAFFGGELNYKETIKRAKELDAKVRDSIDRFETVKDSAAYTFGTSLNDAIEKYFRAVKQNPKEEARFAKQSKRREALIARGKHVDWKVIPKVVFDLNDLQNNIIAILDRMAEKYRTAIEQADSLDCNQRAVAMVDWFKEKASKAVYKITRAMAKETAIKLMEEVGIAEPRMRYYQYPFEFSGGMRQRFVIAIALAADPEILICDEPTTALDVTIQAQILELINNLKRERNLSVIFITHDLGVVANMADDIAVMYAGKIVEYGSADDIFYDPRHPYTWALLSSMPDLDTKEKLDAIPGTPPNMIYPPVGDAFADRNKYAMQIDFEQQPPMFKVSDTHYAATWLLHPDAPKVEIPKIITDRIERMTRKAGADSEQ